MEKIGKKSKENFYKNEQNFKQIYQNFQVDSSEENFKNF